MGCTGCTVRGDGANHAGCNSKGCSSAGGCNRLNTYDWLATMDVVDVDPYSVVEVSFKNGARKGFYRNEARAVTGDHVVVETNSGYDIGVLALSGDLVRLQMKKKRVDEEAVIHNVLRRANDRDLERLAEARSQERKTMIRARAIARTLGLDMKVGDIEYQGDKRKATFYYTADGRVDFRELIRHYAKEFRVKIEMRQIGARQESARIGGLGSCGRELCCSTWLTDFKSVSTAAARYQNLAINQAKLSGQCGRLKCCLNYELDTYMDALDAFPEDAERLKTEAGVAVLIKTDIFRKFMFYAYEKDGHRGKAYQLELARVHEIIAMNKDGRYPSDLIDLQMLTENAEEVVDFESVNDVIDLPIEKRKKGRRRKKRNNNREGGQGQSGQAPKNRSGDGGGKNANSNKENNSSNSGGDNKSGNRNNRRRSRPKNKPKGPKND
ncbi:MAG: hypothetical protein KDC44_10035 [Phaeodactylibacter sp.]|nr:hypothetical protein [Phaeodactylibacter sp.]